MALSFASISGASDPAWFSALQACLGQPILNGCELFKHLWDSLSCMAVSFSSTSGAAYPEWPSAFQASLGQPILNVCKLFKHLWDSVS